MNDSRITAAGQRHTSFTPPEHPGADVSVFRALTPLVRRWRLIIGLPLAAATAVAGISLALPTRFTAVTTFTADASPSLGAGGIGGLASIAGKLGVASLTGGTASPEFFADILVSRELLEAALLSRFQHPSSGHPDSLVTLLQVLEPSGETELERLADGVRKLRGRVAATVRLKTGVVELSVELGPASLAADVANRMIGLLDAFATRRLRSQSGEQRRFTEIRMGQAHAELSRAENNHLQFLRANRVYSDPVLSFQQKRFEREVQLKQEIYLTLVRQYEDARIAEARDVPAITVIDRAVPPDKKSFPRRILLTLAAAIVTGALALAVVYFQEALGAAREAPDADLRQLQLAIASTRREVRGLLPRLRRGTGAPPG